MSLIERLQQLPDCRKARGQRHPQWLILLLVILGGLAGYWGNRPVAEFAQRYGQAIFDKLGLPPEIKPPSYSTVRRLMQQLDYGILAQLFTDWAMEETELEVGQWLATDGKGIGSTLTDHLGAEQNFVSLVSLFSHRSGMVQGVMPWKTSSSVSKKWCDGCWRRSDSAVSASQWMPYIVKKNVRADRQAGQRVRRLRQGQSRAAASLD